MPTRSSIRGNEAFLSLASAAAASAPLAPSCLSQDSATHCISDTDLIGFVKELPFALFVLSSQTDILYRNARAEEMLAERTIARCLHGKLVVNAPQVRRLDRLVGWAASATSVMQEGLCMAMTAPDASAWVLQMHVRPSAGHWSNARVAVALRQVVLDLNGVAVMMSDLFTLTPAERRALPAILRPVTLREAALSLGLLETTMRTHLRNVCAKTGTRTRNDLFRLAGGFARACGL